MLSPFAHRSSQTHHACSHTLSPRRPPLHADPFPGSQPLLTPCPSSSPALSINKLVRVGRNECVVVLRVDKEKVGRQATHRMRLFIHPLPPFRLPPAPSPLPAPSLPLPNTHASGQYPGVFQTHMQVGSTRGCFHPRFVDLYMNCRSSAAAVPVHRDAAARGEGGIGGEERH